MINFKTKVGNFQVPSNYSDITLDDLNFYRANIKHPLKVWSRITGLAPEIVSVLDLTPVVECLDFIKTPVLDIIEASPSILIHEKLYLLPDDLGSGEWAQKLLTTKAIGESDLVKALAIYLQPVFYKRDFDNEKVDRVKDILSKLDVETVFSSVKYVLEKLKTLNERDKKQLKSEITHEQKRAGIDMFNDLGDFNTINMIAGGDVTKYDEVLRIDYNTIFNKLYHIKISAKFDKALNKILNE